MPKTGKGEMTATLFTTGGGNTASGKGPGATNNKAVGGGGGGGSGAKGKKGNGKKKGKNEKKVAHPVEVITGQVTDEAEELFLPGPIPVLWSRSYWSAFSDETSPLGRGGWTHALDQWIAVVEGELTLRLPEGRNLGLPDVEVGASALLRGERLSVTRTHADRYELSDLDARTTKVFESLGRGEKAMLREIKDAWGNAVDLVYVAGRLSTVRAFTRELRLTYDAKGLVVRAEIWADGAAQQAMAYAYTKSGELARATDALGHAQHFAYDALHRLVKSTLENGVSFYYTYDDETGRCVHTWGDGGIHDVELTYDLDAGTTVAAGEEVKVYTWANGALLREETPDGDFATEYTYDEDQLVLTEKNAAGETWESTYDERGNRVKLVDPAGNETVWVYRGDLLVRRITPDGLITGIAHNAQGAPIEIRVPTGLTYQLGYDGAGHLVYLYATEGMLGSWSYDEKHDLIKETDARGASTAYTYDPMGRPLTQTDALDHVSSAEYDKLGRPVAIRRNDGTRVGFAYDAMGNLTRQVDALGRATQMDYAGTGVLVRQTLPNGQVWHFEHDGMERLRTITNPKKEEYEFTYDRGGRVIEERTFDGRVLKYAYDKASRLRRVDYPDETYREFSYDPLGNVLEEKSPHGPQKYGRDKLGRLLAAAVIEHNGKTVVELERDRFGRVVKEIQNGLEIASTYDARGRRETRALPAGETTTYRYDRAGALSSLEHDGHKLAITRDTLGRETKKTSGRALELVSTYDAMSRLESRIAKSAERVGEAAQRVLSERKWSYDGNGRVTGIEDSRWGQTRYGYDEIGQLIEAQRGKRHEVFYYDAAGSLSAAVEGLTSRAVPWTVGEGNLLGQTDDADFEYDARRRRVTEKAKDGKVTKYYWDCRDRLREVEFADGTRALYTYDAFGRRVRKELVPAEKPDALPSAEPERVRVVTFLWDGNALAQEIDTERGKRVYVHGARGSLVPLLQQEQGEVFTYVTDPLGTPKELLDASGRVAWSAAHSAWGSVVEEWRDPGAKTVSSPFRLLGQYHDEETGLAYTRFRYFDAAHGRWISPDPLGIRGGSNLSGFDGSPSNDSDPLGLCKTAKLGNPNKGGTGAEYDKAEGQGVYVLVDKDGNVKYVGRGDAPERGEVHADTPGKNLLGQKIIFDNDLDKAQAKGLEQRLMNHFGGPESMNEDTPLQNKINSYSPNNPNAPDYTAAISDAQFNSVLQNMQNQGINTTKVNW